MGGPPNHQFQCFFRHKWYGAPPMYGNPHLIHHGKSQRSSNSGCISLNALPLYDVFVWKIGDKLQSHGLSSAMSTFKQQWIRVSSISRQTHPHTAGYILMIWYRVISQQSCFLIFKTHFLLVQSLFCIVGFTKIWSNISILGETQVAEAIVVGHRPVEIHRNSSKGNSCNGGFYNQVTLYRRVPWSVLKLTFGHHCWLVAHKPKT